MTGTARQPHAEIAFDASDVTAQGEHAERVRGMLLYEVGALALTSAEFSLGTSKVMVAGTFEHPMDDYKNGTLSGEVMAQNLAFSRIAALREPGSYEELRPLAPVPEGVDAGKGEPASDYPHWTTLPDDQLRLAPGNPTAYEYEGTVRPMTSRTVTVAVREVFVPSRMRRPE